MAYLRTDSHSYSGPMTNLEAWNFESQLDMDPKGLL